jgi:hypothetical protein
MDEALGWLDKACRDAPPDSLRAMVQVLLHHDDPRVVAFARVTAARLQDDREHSKKATS